MSDSEKTKSVSVDEPDAQEATEAPPEPLTPERVNEWNAYYDRYVILSVLALVFVVSANKITHPSIWPQLKVGMMILEKGAPVTTDVFSYTETGKRWVNVQWLFDLGHALAYNAGASLAPYDRTNLKDSTAKAEQFGAGTLVALNALIRLMTALTLMKIRRPGVGAWWAAVCAFIALGAVISPAALLNPRTTGGLPGMVLLGGLASPGLVTPSNWGLLFLVIEMLLIQRATELGRKGAAFVLPVLFALWANIDDSFIIGLLVLLVNAIGLIKPARDREPGGLTLPMAFVVLAASAAACLVNPSIFGVYTAALEPFLGLAVKQGETSKLDQLSLFSLKLRDTPERMAEWRVQFAFYLILVALGLGSFFLNRARFSLSRFLVFLLGAGLWAMLIRFVPEFSVILAATLALNGQEWYQDSFGTEGRLGAGWSIWSVGGRAVTILVIALCIMKGLTGIGGYYNDTQFGFGFDPDDYAFEAASYLKTSPIEGNILNNTAAQGDALIWRAYPERKTYLDSRRSLFPPDVLDNLEKTRVALREDDVENWEPLLDKYKISVIMLPMSTSQTGAARLTYQTLIKSLNWLPFYDDGNVVLFGRTTGSVPAGDLAYFKEHRLDPEFQAFKQEKTIPAQDRLPSPVSWYDKIFQVRAQTRPQPHTDASRRWLTSMMYDSTATAQLPDPARNLMAIREARIALASKPDDSQAFRLLATAYRNLMIQESALLNGIALKPENMAKIAQVQPRFDYLTIRFRQRATALNFAIQTTPPYQSDEARQELMALNLELFQLYVNANYLDLARDRLAVVKSLVRPNDFNEETLTAFTKDFARLDEQVKDIQAKKDELSIEQQLGSVQLASYAISRGAPGVAIQDLEEAERTGASPAQVKPILLELYCDTGQPEKAVEILASGTVGDPTFGREPGISEMRQGRTYFLWGNYDYAATLWEQNAILKVRQERANSVLQQGQMFLRGEVLASATSLLEIPDKIATQASWEFEAGLSRLEGGKPKLAAQHFTTALKLVPNMGVRPVIAYYLEKLGEPVPPLPATASTKAEPPKPASATEKPKDVPAEKVKEPKDSAPPVK
jgi:hypothetical protein